MRKLVYGTLALSAAMAVAFGANVKDADAASAPIKKVMATGDTLTIETSGVKTLLVGVPSISKGRNDSYAKAKVANWDYYTPDDDDMVSVDISKYAITKENYLMVKYDCQTDDQAVLVKIPAAPAVKSVKMDAKTDAITIAMTSGEFPEKFVYYSENGAVNDLTGSAGSYTIDDIKLYKYAGATLYVRAKEANATGQAVTAVATSQVVLKNNSESLKTESGAEIPSYTLPARQGKAFKITVSKSANAPTIKVDYVNGKITIPGKGSAPIMYSFGGEQGKLDGMGANQDFTFKPSEGVTQSVTAGVTSNVEVDLNKNIQYAYGNFYVDVQGGASSDAATTKKARYVFKGLTSTKLSNEGEEGVEEDEIQKYVTAQVKWNKNKYVVALTNTDQNNAYIVTVPGTKAVTINKASTTKASTATITPANAVTDVAGAEALKVFVQRQGNKTTAVFPGIAEELPSGYVTVVNDKNTNANFGVSYSDQQVGSKSLAEQLVVSNVDGIEASMSSMSEFKGNGTTIVRIIKSTKATEDFDLDKIVVKYYDTTSTKADKWVTLTKNNGKFTKSPDDDGKVTQVSFTMPAYNVQISYA